MSLKKVFHLKKSSKKGMALIMVLSTIIFVILVIQETVFETQVEYRSAIAELNSLRAYYAAKSGMEVNILRIKSYTKIINSYDNKTINQFRPYINLIWRLPFQWPPSIPKELDSITAEEVSKISDGSFMQAQFTTLIEPESSKIDINDLASPIPSLRVWTHNVLSNLIALLRINNKKLDDALSEQDINNILNNIKDWADPDTRQSERNTPESHLYDQTGLPRNRSFVSIEELRQVAGISDILYTTLKPFITIYGEKGLSVNTSSNTHLIQALLGAPLELAQEINELISHPINPVIFTKKTFFDFLNEKGFSELNQHLIPPDNPQRNQKDQHISYLIFDAPYNFRMQSTGFAGNSQRTLTAIYFDTTSFSNRFNKLMATEKQREKIKIINKITTKTVRTAPDPTPRRTDQNPPLNQKQEPTIIYWKESF
ncbi:MAG: type II secretion system protein GspK [Bdellovibrionales bacterium]|nr:type II secretion system protein GspK [Bdellovibrionales bacterium]